MKIIQKMFNIIAILTFFLMLWLPIFKMKNNPVVAISEKEKRMLNQLVAFDIKHASAFFNTFELFFNDHFGYRNDLIRWHSNLSLALLKQSSIEGVILGKNGWLFYSVGLNDQKIRPPYNLKELSIIASNTKKINLLVREKKGILITLVAPDKHTIYSENLPWYILQQNYKNPRLDQRINVLKKNLGNIEIDLRPFLLAAKENNRIYYKTDTHWNNYASFVAYEQIMQQVKKYYPNIDVLEKSDFDILEIPIIGKADLYSFLSTSTYFADTEVSFVAKKEAHERKLTSNKKLDKIIIYQDSFFDSTYPWGTVKFLALHFNEVILERNTLFFKHERISTGSASVVIFETAERSL